MHIRTMSLPPCATTAEEASLSPRERAGVRGNLVSEYQGLSHQPTAHEDCEPQPASKHNCVDRLFIALPMMLPLPKGEGRGEGEGKLEMGLQPPSTRLPFALSCLSGSLPSSSGFANGPAIVRQRVRGPFLERFPNRVANFLLFAAQTRIPKGND